MENQRQKFEVRVGLHFTLSINELGKPIETVSKPWTSTSVSHKMFKNELTCIT